MNKHLDAIQKRLVEKRMNYQGPHCCFDMDSMLKQKECPIYNIGYDQKRRDYYLESQEGYVRNIDYCPWCGKKLPKELSNEWFDIIRNEFHLDPWDQDDYTKIPQEFLTEEWWKKRGL